MHGFRTTDNTFQLPLQLEEATSSIWASEYEYKWLEHLSHLFTLDNPSLLLLDGKSDKNIWKLHIDDGNTASQPEPPLALDHDLPPDLCGRGMYFSIFELLNCQCSLLL